MSALPVDVLAEPTEEILTRICEAHWNGCKGEGIHFSDVYQHDAINHTLSGTIEADGVSYGFIIRNGNWNGTEVLEWGLEDDVGSYQHPEPPEPITFVPNDPHLFARSPEMFKVYGMWRKEKWFTEKVGGYNYDRHFAPGGKTETYYREWAAKRGMKPGYLINFSKEELAAIGATP